MKVTTRYRIAAMALFLGYWGLPAAYAQTTAGIRGTVSDASNAPVSGAELTVTNTATGFAETVKADSSGVYTFTLLPVGTYQLVITAAGFETVKQDDITLTTNQVLGLNFQLQLGTLRQSVEVSGAVTVVNTQTTDVSTLITPQQMRELPLNGRNPIQLATLTNGVNVASVPTVIQGNDARSMSHLSVNGNQEFMTEYDLDGGRFQDPELNSGLNYPNPDAIREIRFVTSNYSAEYGQNAGGVLSVVTNSGTNDLHGDAWEFNRNGALAARTFFLPRVAPLNQNQFGFTLGGPIKKNKLFLFGTGQWLRLRQGSAVSSAFPPNAAERRGDFSGSAPVIDPTTGKQFPDNMIPQGRMDPVVSKYLNLIPLPNSPDGSFRGAFSQPSNNYQWLVKPDYLMTSKQRLSGSVFIDRTASTSLTDFGRFNIPFINTTGNPLQLNNINFSSVILDHTYSIGPTVLNYARFSFLQGVIQDLAHRGPTLIDLGTSFPSFPLPDIPEIDAAGRYSVGTGNFSDTNWQQYEFSDNVNFIRGAHSVKVGGSYQHIDFYDQNSANSSGYFGATGAVTTNPLADMMLGMTQSYVSNPLTLDVSQRSFSAYVQDDYKISRSVVVNLGLRYQNADMFEPQPSAAFKTPSGGLLRSGTSFIEGQQSRVFKNAPAGLVFPPQPGFGNIGDPGIPSTMVYTPQHEFSPRIGIAWDVFGNGKTALRAGYGIFYDSWHVNTLLGELEGPPFFVNFFQSVTPNLTNPVGSLANLFPVKLTQDLNFGPFSPQSLESVDPNMTHPLIQQYNFTVQQQLGGGVALQAAYVGNAGRHLMFTNNINPAIYIPGVDSKGNPLSTLDNENSRRPLNQSFLPSIPFGQVGNNGSRANSSYNSLQVQLETRAHHGLSFLAAYTWSKTLDLTSYLITTGTFTGTEQNPFDINAEKGLADYNREHVFTASLDYEVPSVTRALGTDNWALRGILDGWELSSIVSIASGFPFTVSTGTDNSLTGVNNDRPNLIGNPYLSTGRSTAQKISEYFNTAAFQENTIGTFGDVGRNTLVGPGSTDVDLGAFKNFPTWERVRLQLRFEFFNLLNTPNFSNPVSTMSAGPTFGRITSAGPGRVIQIGGKVIF